MPEAGSPLEWCSVAGFGQLVPDVRKGHPTASPPGRRVRGCHRCSWLVLAGAPRSCGVVACGTIALIFRRTRLRRPSRLKNSIILLNDNVCKETTPLSAEENP